jgi:hypothetical protein
MLWMHWRLQWVSNLFDTTQDQYPPRHGVRLYHLPIQHKSDSNAHQSWPPTGAKPEGRTKRTGIFHSILPLTLTRDRSIPVWCLYPSGLVLVWCLLRFQADLCVADAFRWRPFWPTSPPTPEFNRCIGQYAVKEDCKTLAQYTASPS